MMKEFFDYTIVPEITQTTFEKTISQREEVSWQKRIMPNQRVFQNSEPEPELLPAPFVNDNGSRELKLSVQMAEPIIESEVQRISRQSKEILQEIELLITQYQNVSIE